MGKHRLEAVDGKLTLFHDDFPEYKGLSVDFCDKASLRRLTEPFAKDPLRKAFGSKSLAGAVVWDLTLGLGRDTFEIARMGAEVHAFERSPEIFALWEDARKRAAPEPKVAAIFSRIHGECADAGEKIRVMVSRRIPAPDFIYIDPMYPEAGESAAKRRKEMVLLRALVGDDADALGIFVAARSVNPKRIVVKRPLHAPVLAPADVEFRGKSHRFDVYLAD